MIRLLNLEPVYLERGQAFVITWDESGRTVSQQIVAAHPYKSCPYCARVFEPIPDLPKWCLCGELIKTWELPR